MRLSTPFLLALSLLLVASGASGCTTPEHRRHRHLLDAAATFPAAEAAEASAPAPAPAATSAGSTIIETLVDQKCSMMHHALVAGTVLLRGSENMQPDEASCCKSCLDHPRGCTAWVYCPREGGCSASGAANITLVRRGSDSFPAPSEAEQQRQLMLPHRGCRLLAIDAFRLRKDSPQILAKGPEVQFISGTPVTITLPVLPGYSVRPGTDTAAGLGYKCAESLLLYSCLLQGSVEELARICEADPLCKAFVYLPNGVDSFSEPIGIFKGGADIQTIPISALAPNPSTALYIKNSVETTSGSTKQVGVEAGRSGGGDDGTNVLWIVLPTLLAAALLLVTAVAIYATVAMQQQARKQATAASAEQQQAATSKRSISNTSSKGQQQASPGTAIRAAAAATAPGAAAVPGQQPGFVPPLMVHLLKPSPPDSGGSSDGGGGGSPSASSTHSAASSGCMQCPSCGTALSLRYRQASQQQRQQPQQLPQQRAQQQQPPPSPPPQR